MFAFPPLTAFGRTIPKSRIYTHADATRRIRDLFAAQIAEIRWAHKLAPETLHLPARPGVPEIQIFDLTLKTPEVDEVVLDTIDRAIPYPVLYRIRSERGVAYCAAFKRPSEADPSQWVVGSRFSSGFAEPVCGLPPMPTVLDLGHLYVALFAPLLPLPGRRGESLAGHVGRCERFLTLKRQVDQMRVRLHREKQFNRKVELNQRLKPLLAELEVLKKPCLAGKIV